MLQKYKLTMKCVSAGKVHGIGGSELHGMLFSIIKEKDSQLASVLHNSGDKPFSLSLFYGPGERNNDVFYCYEGDEYYFYLSCLNDEMCKIGEELAEDWPGKNLRVGSGIFTGKTTEILLPQGFDYHDLYKQPPVTGEIKMDFLSPTSFRSQGRQILFPLPEKVFASLQRRWNAFSPVRFQNDTDFSFIVVSRYNLRTELVSFEKYRVIGFKGQCRYRILHKYEEIMASRVSALARFAEIGGCGYKTSMGLGHVVLGM